jgi:hypothetical protein
VDFHEKEVSLQDYGLHFAVSINAFQSAQRWVEIGRSR